MTQIDTSVFEQENPHILDRSTLEYWIKCPAQGAAMTSGVAKVNSPAADSGNEVHTVIGDAMRGVADGEFNFANLRDFLYSRIADARPDVQPDAITGLRKSSYDLARWMLYDQGEPRHPTDFLRYDGGEGEHSGQLSHDIVDADGRPVRITTEVDCVMAGNSDEELIEYDWKSGRGLWSATDVKYSFQFGTFHPAILFWNYPQVKLIHIRVWNTRVNQISGVVTFKREWLADMEARMMGGVRAYLAWDADRSKPQPCYPAMEKCAWCDASANCHEANAVARDVSVDPVAALRQLIAKDAQVDELRKAMMAHVKKNGEIVDPETSECFGYDKPKTQRRTAGIYKL